MRPTGFEPAAIGLEAPMLSGLRCQLVVIWFSQGQSVRLQDTVDVIECQAGTFGFSADPGLSGTVGVLRRLTM